ncbi:uncharacterized protein LOC120538991 isoform X1 [Polypterus senegalus]|uniref:uncharacterized protein LOC120538991 isoform X1 n=1 Tax=Polypterus senegalus TaxID=55291 RepID=UPI001963B399|nr:uncharacterized protein LOC120538991 isoform X1 [Polypterus senegalus]
MIYLLIVSMLLWNSVRCSKGSHFNTSHGGDIHLALKDLQLPVTCKWTPRYQRCIGDMKETEREIYYIDEDKNGTVKQERFKDRLHLENSDNIKLVLKNVTMSDTGIFNCSSHNMHYEAFTVEVSPACAHNGIPSVSVVKKDNIFELCCTYCDGSPISEKNYEWQLNGEKISHDMADISLPEKNCLSIAATKYEGKWTCGSHVEYCLEGISEKATISQKKDNFKDSAGYLVTGFLITLLIFSLIGAGIWYRKTKTKRMKNRNNNSTVAGVSTGEHKQQQDQEVQYSLINISVSNKQQTVNSEERVIYCDIVSK